MSHTSAVHVVPLLARIVLCAVFVPAGYNKIFKDAPATQAEVARLEALGWGWTPPPAIEGAPTITPSTPVTPPASPSTPSAPTSPAPKSAPPATPPSGAPGTAAPAAPAAPPPARSAPSAMRSGASIRLASLQARKDDTAATPAPSGPRLRQLDQQLALALDKMGFPAPRLSAWLVALVELVGGAFILVGFLSRLAALGLTVVMAGALSMTSFPALKEHPTLLDMPPEAFGHFGLQAALFVLAVGVLLVGPGGFSVDAILFGRTRSNGGTSARGGGGGSAAA